MAEKKKTTKMIYLLTGDIGGTNSRMALYSAASTECHLDKPLYEKTYRNSEQIPSHLYDDPDVFPQYIIMPFLKYCWEENNNSSKKLATPTLHPLSQSSIVATLATAGMVNENRANLTNLGGMLIDGTAVAANGTCEFLKHIVVCRIINDFVAQGYGCLTLEPKDVRPLFGPSNLEDLPVGPKVCIGAGTGLGECYLTPNAATAAAEGPNSRTATTAGAGSSTYQCFASEGGHVEYSPRNELEIRMFQYLDKKFNGQGRISVERVVSGTGLANVYEFLAHKFPNRRVKRVHEAFLKAGDEQGKIVALNAKSGDKGSLCEQAVSIMMSAYGCEAGSAAIKWIPTGGLFVTGGLTPKNIEYIDGLHTDFMKSYLNKGRVRPLLERVPLFAVMVEDLGVRGAHKAALMEYETYLEWLNAKGANNKAMYNDVDDSDELQAEFPWIVAVATTILVVGLSVGTTWCRIVRR